MEKKQFIYKDAHHFVYRKYSFIVGCALFYINIVECIFLLNGDLLIYQIMVQWRCSNHMKNGGLWMLYSCQLLHQIKGALWSYGYHGYFQNMNRNAEIQEFCKAVKVVQNAESGQIRDKQLNWAFRAEWSRISNIYGKISS